MADTMFALLAAIYSSVLTNKVKTYTMTVVIPSLIAAGLPLTSVNPFLAALATGNLAAVQKVPGVNASIIEVGITNLTDAYAEGFKIGQPMPQSCLSTASFY